MRLRHIEVFNAVMLTGSVSAAARLINVTQPAVSRLLQHAEIQLGFALFQRTRGRLVPTSEALALYPHIEQLFTQLGQVQRLATGLRGGDGATQLRVRTVLALSYEVLPRAIAQFRKRHPDVAISIEALHSPQVVASVALQEADVGFVFNANTHPALVQEPLAAGRMVCVAPKGMLPTRLLKRGDVSLLDLTGLPLIGLDARDPIGITLQQAMRETGAEEGAGLQAHITVQTYHAALALAHHGLGLALVDSCTAVSADRARVDVLVVQPQIAVPVHAIYPTGKPGSVATRAFVRCVQQAVLALKELA
jgi:DNA-binding transcriptional LysR family regulator